MREEEHARILACSKTLWPERVCYQEGCVARGWGFRVERRKEREIKSPSLPSSPLPHWLAVTDFGSAIYESLLKTHAVKLVFLHLEKFCQMP